MKRSAAGTIPYGSVLLTLVALLLKTSASFRVPAAGSAMIDDDNDGYGSTKASNFIGVTTSSGVNENDIAAGSGDGDEIATPTVSAVVLDEADDKMARDAMIVDSSTDTWANSDDDGGLSVRSTEKTMDDGTRDTIVANQVDQNHSSASASAKDSTAATTTTNRHEQPSTNEASIATTTNRHEQPSTSEASIATTTTTTKTEDEGSTATTAKIKEPAATTAIDASIATTTTTKTEEPMARTTTEASIATTTQTEEPPATTMTTEEASIAASTTKTEAKAPSATTIATERELATTQRSLDIQTTTTSEVAGSSTTSRATAATESTEGGLTGTSTSGRRTTPVVTANSATLETSTMLYRTDDDDGKTRSVSSATIHGHPRKGTEASTVAKDSPTSERSVDAAVPVTGNAKYADKPPTSYDGDDERAVIADLSRLLSRQVSDVRDFCETGSYAQLAGTLASGLALFVSFVVTMCQLQRLLRNQQQLLRAFETLASGPQRGPKTPFVARGSIVSSSSSSTTTTNQTNNHDDPASIPLLLRSRPRGGDRRLPPSPLFGRRSDRSVAK